MHETGYSEQTASRDIVGAYTSERTDAVIKHDRIESNPELMFGKPIIKGTRVTVAQVLRKLGAGMAHQDIPRDHPCLTLKTSAAREREPPYRL